MQVIHMIDRMWTPIAYPAASDLSTPSGVALAEAAAGVVLLAMGGWYAQRQWLR